MEYKQAWEEYKETIQSSIYMQKLSLKEDEKIFKAGFDKALEKIHFVNRFEVINHTKTGDLVIEAKLQDNSKTL